ncbi:MAG TPA: glycine cleavage system aminomethyltransferase GcvT [Microthrixaceae bacterium]|nr:glycine cleavage system aminomethyltransferase GcvT [Microthrixaceae bacterium]
MTIQHSPLDATHRELGAKMVPFGGWDMPLSYPAGTLAEHQACRSAAVVFDVSHLGTVRVSGPGAFDALQRAFTNDLAKIEPGRCQYTHSLSEDGSVADDIIVWWRAADVFDVMPNASNTDRICRALVDGAAGAEVKVDDVTTERAVIAVQGPQARELLAPLLPEAAAVGRFRIIETTFDGTPIVIAGTGYTGEDGLEIAVPAQRAAELWRAVTAMGIEPAGLGARDTLRLEAGLPLHGHELGDGITSLNADLEWVVSWTKGDFVGREALAAQKEAGVTPILRGLSVDTKRPPRAEMDVYRGDTLVGRITSGNISPVLGHGIAMAMIEPGLELGSVLEVDLRGKRVPATVVEMPFVKR